MENDISQLWPCVGPPSSARDLTAHLQDLWRHLSRHGRAASSAYEREQVADAMVVLEATLVDLSTPCAVADEAARVLADSLTRWRTHRDIAATCTSSRALLGPALEPWEPESPSEIELMTTCEGHLDAGLPPLLAHLAELARRIEDDYLRPAKQAIDAVAETAKHVWDEGRTEGPEAITAALWWLLNPISSAHTCALMAHDAVPALRRGDLRAATVANRWAYSRVRTETLALLTARHVRKTRQLVAGLPI